MKKKITVITPTFNSANTILANLASVKNQKYKNLEHIIIDNKSVDGTLNLIKKQNDKKKIVKKILGKKNNSSQSAEKIKNIESIRNYDKSNKDTFDVCTILEKCSIDEISKYLLKEGKKRSFPDITTRQ